MTIQNVKVLPVVAYSRAHTEDAIAVLVDLMMTAEKDSTKVTAAIALLDRGWGKPPQQLTVTETPNSKFNMNNLTPEQLRAFHDLLKKVDKGAEVVDEAEVVDPDLKNVTSLSVVPPQAP